MLGCPWWRHPMAAGDGISLIESFSALSDPRQAAKVLYPLPEILLLLLCATLSGADDFVEIEIWGEEHLAFLRRLLPLSMLLGAAFLLAVDTLARTAGRVEVPLGVLTAVLGTPLFLWVLARARRGGA